MQLDRLVPLRGRVVVSPAGRSRSALMAAAACCGGASDPISGPSAPTLLVVQSQVFTPRCALPGCHVGATAPFGMNLQSASTLRGESHRRSQRGDAGPDARRSRRFRELVPLLEGDAATRTSAAIRMPLSGGPLSNGELSLIASWIDGGAK